MRKKSLKQWVKFLLPPICLLLLGAILSYSQLLIRVDRVMYDFLSGSLSRPVAENIVIIAIDEDSLDQYGQWPWPRKLHAELIDKISIGGAKAVGFDIVASEPSRLGPEDDTALAESVSRSERVIMPIFAEWSVQRERLMVVGPVPLIGQAAAGLGHVDFELDPDGILRRTFLKAGLNSASYNSLAQEMLALTEQEARKYLPGETNPSSAPEMQGKWVRNYEVLIPFAGKPNHYSRISYAQFMQPEFDPVVIKDKFVLVGVTAAGVSDTLPTPVSGESVPMPGVEVNASLLDALQHRLLIVPLDDFARLITTLFFISLPLFSFAFLSNRSLQLMVVVWIGLIIVISSQLLARYQLWYSPAPALLVLIVSYPLWAWSKVEGLMGRLFREREKAAVTLHSIGDGVITTDKEFRIQFMNPAAERMTGYRKEQCYGVLFSELFPMVNRNKDAKNILPNFQKQLFEKKIVHFQDDLIFNDKDGVEHIVRLSGGPIKDQKDKILGAVFGLNDITEKEQALSRLTYEATHDHLTSLPNRSLLFDRILQALHRARRSGNKIAILFLDLDNFKKVNDQIGHSGGDLLLQMVGLRLKQNCRSGDTVARLGGDEFVVLLEDFSDHSTAAIVAEKYIQVLRPPFKVKNHDLYVTGSIGISVFPRDGEDVDTLMKNADIAMFEAKKSGRNNYLFFSDEMNRLIQQRLQLERQLRIAINQAELELYYQPQIRLKDHKIVGIEALTRWTATDKIRIPPSSFIPIAEESGLILPLSEWILKTACKQVRSWQDTLGYSPKMSVNISPRHFREEDLLQQISAIICETGIDPQNLDLELTEGLIMQDVERSADIMRSFKSLGGTVTIDDFGTGYSSLSYLKKFPLDKLKIDKSFVNEIDRDEKDEGLARTIITMGHGLGLIVVAEGVETRRQIDKLKELGCDIIQGYYFSHPLPAEDVFEMLKKSPFLGDSDIT